MDVVHAFDSVVRHGQNFHYRVACPHLCAETRDEVVPHSRDHPVSSGRRGSDPHCLDPNDTRRRLVEPFGWRYFTVQPECGHG